MGHQVSAETRARMSAAKMGHQVSAETRMKLSLANRGYKHTDEAKAKIAATSKGRKMSVEARAKISAAMVGNKYGVGHKLSDEAKTKIAIASRGRKMSDSTKAKLLAANRGRKMSTEVKQKLSERWTGSNNPNYGKVFSEEEKRRLSEKLSGVNSLRWRGGCFHGYSADWKVVKKTIRHRDRVCTICGRASQFRQLSVHHIDMNKINNDPMNLVATCVVCHGKIHATVDSEQMYEVMLSNWIRQKYGLRDEGVLIFDRR